MGNMVAEVHDVHSRVYVPSKTKMAVIRLNLSHQTEWGVSSAD